MGADMPRPEPWENPDPERFHFEPHLAGAHYRIDQGRRCRWTVEGHRACGEPSVLAIRRGEVRPQWWAYCAEHTYGRWIEGDRVLEWRLVRNDTGDSQ